MSNEKGKVFSLIRKIDEGNLTEEQIKKNLPRLFTMLDNCMPKYLFKYRHFDENGHAVDNLEKGLIRVSLSSEFNDPMDCLVYVNGDDFLKIDREVTSINETEDLFYYIKENGHLPPTDYPIKPELKQMVEEAAKRGEFNEVFLKEIKNPLNNCLKVFERLGRVELVQKQVRNELKIACLSETIRSPLMWSHYADSHKGFAVRYKTDAVIKECANCQLKGCRCYRKDKPFFPIQYKDIRFNATKIAFYMVAFEQIAPSDYYTSNLPLMPILQKSKDWDYEKEWRIVCRNKKIDFFEMKPDAVFIGLDIKDGNKQKIMDIAKKKKINVFQMFITPTNKLFELDYKVIYSAKRI